MKKIALIAAGVLAVSSSAALAQTNWMPPGPNSAPGGATGAAQTRDVGTNTPNVAHTGNGQTNSNSMLDQSVKEQSAAGAPRSVYSPNAPTRFDFTKTIALPSSATNLQVYYHLKAFVVAPAYYDHASNVKVPAGSRALVREVYDNPNGSGTNYRFALAR